MRADLRQRPPGGHLEPGGSAFFRVWAPRAQRVEVFLQNAGGARRHALSSVANGYFEGLVAEAAAAAAAAAGDRYGYCLDGGEPLPDPRSRYQPDGVEGLSMLVDPGAFAWTDATWRGHSLGELVIYELHIGTFTARGTFQAAIDRLDELRELGVTVVELMPLAQCPGRWNWGYDGVNLFAPSHTFGSPDDVRRFVDACHARGLAVFIDVVYNHLGPEGNTLGAFGPYFRSDRQTPWGQAPEFEGEHAEPVRRLVIDNAVAWIREYHADGLRIDATRTMIDSSRPHILAEIREAVEAVGREQQRQVYVVAENNLHEPHVTAAPEVGGLGLDAQWSDDLGHALLTTLEGRPQVLGGRRYVGFSDLAATLRQGYRFQGDGAGGYLPVDAGEAADLARLVVSLQNHDKVGNHPSGKRVTAFAGRELHAAAAALVLLYPAIPLLFMGEEVASEQPFYFFADFASEALRRGVEQGRAEEFPQHDWRGSVSPVSAEAFIGSKLNAADPAEPMRWWYTRLLRLRREWRQAGWLSRDRLEVESDEASRSVLLRYRLAGRPAADTVFVAARLAAPGTPEATPSIHLHGVGERLADSQAPQTAPTPVGAVPCVLAPAHAIVGTGAARLEGA